MERCYVYAWIIGWRRVFTRFYRRRVGRKDPNTGGNRNNDDKQWPTRELQRQQPDNQVRFNDRACWRMFKRALNATARWERWFRPRGGKRIGGRRGEGRGMEAKRWSSIENEQWGGGRGGFREIIVRRSDALREEFWLSWKIHGQRPKHDKRLSRSCIAFAGQFLPEFRSTAAAATATVNYRFRPHASGST